MHHHVIAYLEIVPEREFYELKAFEVAAATGKDVRGEQAAETNPQMDIAAAQRCPVEVLPEPEQRLHSGIASRVHFGIVLGLEGDVVRIQTEKRDPRGGRYLGILDEAIVVPKTRIIELEKEVAGEPVPIRFRRFQSGLELGQPPVEKLLGRLGKGYGAEGEIWH